MKKNMLYSLAFKVTNCSCLQLELELPADFMNTHPVRGRFKLGGFEISPEPNQRN